MGYDPSGLQALGGSAVRRAQERQAHSERAALIQAPAMCFDSTTVELHQALGQCEPDPQAAARADAGGAWPRDSLPPSGQTIRKFHAMAELVTA
jgi:hypothetical protein